MTKLALDQIDFGIIDELQNNARIANKVLAARVGLAPSTCLERVRRMRDAGVLKGAHELVDRQALGIDLEAMIFVRLARHAREAVDSFQEHAKSLDEVVAVYHVSGEHDFLVHVAVRDAHHLRDVAMDSFTTRSDVSNIETHLIFASKRNWRLPVYR
jgi:DNA-binding Lrp family transcriptional regulator